ncbi:phage tail tape measure protein [Rhizobium leguminosarum]
MASRNMALDVLVRLKDMLSSPLRGLRRSLQGVADMAKKIGVVGTAIAAISFMAPMQEAAAFQQQLIDIAGTAGKSGAAAYQMVDELKARYEGLALQIGQTSDTIAKGSGKMIAAGLDEALVDQSLKGIGKATKAANADFDDMAGVAISLLQTLKLPASELDDTFAGLIVAGKEGSFELKDMAKYFPTLTGQMAKLGITGRTAATQLATMLEIARKGTADPAEAANNLNNFLSKITAPETRKNFQKMGVDIQGVMQDAATKGINPIEAVIQKISKLTNISGKEIETLMKKAKANGLEGADALEEVRKQLESIHGAGALGGLFSDMQVMGFLIPMLANIDEYKRIKQAVGDATGAMSDADFATQMESLNTQLVTFSEIGTQAAREVGLAFGTWMPTINRILMDTLRWLREWDKATGGMGRTALVAAGGGILLAGALGAIGVVLPAVVAGMSLLFSPIRLLAQGAIMLGSVLAGPAMAALSAIGTVIAGISAPIWAVVAAVAAVGIAIHHYWEPISNWVAGFGSAIAAGLAAPLAAMSDFAGKVAGWAGQKLLDFAQWLGLDEAAVGAVTGRISAFANTVIETIKAIPAAVGNFLSEIFTMKDYSDEAEAGFRDAGTRAGQAMVDAIKAAFGALMDWFSGLGARIVEAIGKIDISSVMPNFSDYLPSFGFGKDAATPPTINVPSNDNAPAPAGHASPDQRSSLGNGLSPAVAQSPVKLDAGGTLHISADPGLRVASAEPNSSSMNYQTSNTGRAVGRN